MKVPDICRAKRRVRFREAGGDIRKSGMIRGWRGTGRRHATKEKGAQHEVERLVALLAQWHREGADALRAHHRLDGGALPIVGVLAIS